LRDFEECASDPIPVTDAHRIIGQAFDREIFTELSIGLRITEVGPLEVRLPIMIGVDLVHKDGALFPSRPLPISLTVSVQV
jgi:hypothetical protein